MITKNITVDPASVADASTTAMLVQIASQFTSNIHVKYGERQFNAKSIMGMMTLGIIPGAELEVMAEGNDEQAAIDRISDFLSAK